MTPDQTIAVLIGSAISAAALLGALLIGPPNVHGGRDKREGDCDECGRHNPQTMHGTWWHAEGCPEAGPIVRAAGSDDE